jgi:hypothetical protein
VWSRVGTGSVGALVAAVGLSTGALLAVRPPVVAVVDRLSALGIGMPPSLAAWLGVPAWAIVGVAVTVIAVATVSARRDAASAAWPWWITGVALGAVGVLAWLTGAPAGWHWGLSITGPSRSLADVVALGHPHAADWGTAMLVSVPLGARASARLAGRVAWRRPPWRELPRRFAGGLLMGMGGTLAAGCNIGNALTGLSILAANSLVATVAIAAGGLLAVRYVSTLATPTASSAGRGGKGAGREPASA